MTDCPKAATKALSTEGSVKVTHLDMTKALDSILP